MLTYTVSKQQLSYSFRNEIIIKFREKTLILLYTFQRLNTIIALEHV
jgi:hypothetical protein